MNAKTAQLTPADDGILAAALDYCHKMGFGDDDTVDHLTAVYMEEIDWAIDYPGAELIAYLWFRDNNPARTTK